MILIANDFLSKIEANKVLFYNKSNCMSNPGRNCLYIYIIGIKLLFNCNDDDCYCGLSIIKSKLRLLFKNVTMLKNVVEIYNLLYKLVANKSIIKTHIYHVICFIVKYENTCKR